MSEGVRKRTNPVSAGLVLFRHVQGELEVLLAHPGGPFWTNRDIGAWTIPKGQPVENESLLETAIREFREETSFDPRGPYLCLGSVRQRAGKVVHAWAFEGQADPTSFSSNETSTEWPRGSGKRIIFPEIDLCEWFGVDIARDKINPAQSEFLDRLIAEIRNEIKGR